MTGRPAGIARQRGLTGYYKWIVEDDFLLWCWFGDDGEREEKFRIWDFEALAKKLVGRRIIEVKKHYDANEIWDGTIIILDDGTEMRSYDSDIYKVDVSLQINGHATHSPDKE